MDDLAPKLETNSHMTSFINNIIYIYICHYELREAVCQNVETQNGFGMWQPRWVFGSMVWR